MIVFTIMGAPRGWARARLGKSGSHHFTDKKTASYENQVAHAAGIEMGGEDPWQGAVEVTIAVFKDVPASWPKKKLIAAMTSPATGKPDPDNICKIILDGLSGVAFKDDSQVTDLIIRKRYGSVAKTVVKVQKMELFL